MEGSTFGTKHFKYIRDGGKKCKMETIGLLTRERLLKMNEELYDFLFRTLGIKKQTK